MKKDQLYRKYKIWNTIIILFSIIGLITCIAILFPQVRLQMMAFAEHLLERKSATYNSWYSLLFSLASGGVFFILIFDYCTLTTSGRTLVQQVKQDVKACFSEIDFRIFIKPILLMFAVYLLGLLAIIRANFLYNDDVGRAIMGYRDWYNWSRYIAVFFSFIIQPEIHVTDISPIPQLLAILLLSCSSVLLVYILCEKKITTIRLLASIPLGLSPYFLECLSYKFDAPHMALSILACIIPFLFITSKKAFLFVSIISLLVMCMTYQAASGIYIMISIFLCFQYWSNRKKSNKEILFFFGRTIVAFSLAMLIFKFFFLRPIDDQDLYASNAMYPLSQIVSGTLSNIKNYLFIIKNDLGLLWKIGILFIIFLFIIKSICQSTQKKIISFFFSIMFIVLTFISSFGAYSMLSNTLLYPRTMFGFGIFLAIICVHVVTDYKKLAVVAVLALNWCFFTFAFSYGNALADQARYADFRIGILLHDLSNLYPTISAEEMSIQFDNSIEFSPTIKNIAKNNPIIERLVPKRLSNSLFDYFYCFGHFNNEQFFIDIEEFQNIKYSTLDLPVVIDSYYHTIKSDGEHILIIFKH